MYVIYNYCIYRITGAIVTRKTYYNKFNIVGTMYRSRRMSLFRLTRKSNSL